MGPSRSVSAGVGFIEAGTASCYWAARGTRITMSVLRAMNAAGDTVEQLADAYSLDVAEVEAAVGFERALILGIHPVASVAAGQTAVIKK